MENRVQSELAALKATVEAGFASTNRRMDDFRIEHGARSDRIERVQSERHSYNSERLEAIEHEVKVTNGRVTRNEEQIRSLFARLKGTASDLKGAVTLVVGTATVTAAVILWVLKVIGKL